MYSCLREYSDRFLPRDSFYRYLSDINFSQDLQERETFGVYEAALHISSIFFLLSRRPLHDRFLWGFLYSFNKIWRLESFTISNNLPRVQLICQECNEVNPQQDLLHRHLQGYFSLGVLDLFIGFCFILLFIMTIP